MSFDLHGWATDPPPSAGAALYVNANLTGPLLSIPQDQSYMVTLAITDARRTPIDLTGKTVTLELAYGVPGGGAVIGAKPVVIFPRVGTNHSPGALGLVDVAFVPADTVNLAAGQGYVYSVKTTDGSGNVVWVFGESPAIIASSPPGG